MSNTLRPIYIRPTRRLIGKVFENIRMINWVHEKDVAIFVEIIRVILVETITQITSIANQTNGLKVIRISKLRYIASSETES